MFENSAEQIDDEVLCGASKYSRLFYMNDTFDNIPQEIKDQLKIMCVTFTEEIGGTIQLVFDSEGKLYIRTDKNSDDIYYDDIGSGLKVHQIQLQKRGLFEALETYYKVFAKQLHKKKEEQE